MTPLTLAPAVTAGVIAALAYTVVAEAVTLAMQGPSALIIPLRQIAAVVVGPQALAPEYDATTAAVLGTIVHVGVGIFYALAFLVLISAVGKSSKGRMAWLGALYGIGIYGLNRLVMFPAWFPWFLENSWLIQVILHALAFGAVIGWWIERRIEM